MKLCAKCGVNERRPTHAWCNAFHASNMRNWFKTHPRQGLAREKDTSRSYAGVYKRRGKITPQPCQLCGMPAEMHHSDYDQPLKVEWLCREHHLTLHDVSRETGGS